MTADGRRWVLLWTFLVLQIASTRAVHAQELSVVPSFGITELFDDNVFYRPAGEADTTTRFSSRIDAHQKSERATLSARYELDADRFARHPELSTPLGRQEGSLDAQYLTSRRLSFGGAAAYVESQTPGDLNQQTGLAPGRLKAQRLTLQPSATYQFAALNDATVAYAQTRDALAGGVSLVSQSATSTLHHRQSERDGLRLEYTYQRYAFELFASAQQIRQSQVVTAEWTHDLDRLTSVTLRAGPRLTNGAVSPEIAASVRHHLRAGEASVAYLHTQTTLIGLAGVADTHTLAATFAGEPRRHVTLHATPGVSYTQQLNLSSVVYRLSVSCARPIANRLAIEADYDLNLQRGNIYTAQALETIQRNLVGIKLVVADTAPAR